MPQVSILIVEDHAVVREGLHEWLSTTFRGCRLLEASNGEDAVRLALANHPDVIVMDIKMPQMNGLDATRRIKAACPQAKVVIHTNYADSVHQQAALDAGADEFVAKGSIDNALLNAIVRLLPVASSQTSEVNPRIRILIVDTAPAARSLIRSILESDEELTVVAEVHDGHEAVVACQTLHPDLVTLDTALPDPLVDEALRQIMDECPTPILLLTDRTSRPLEAVRVNALALGDLTVVSKPRSLSIDDPEARDLIAHVKTMANANAARRSALPQPKVL